MPDKDGVDLHPKNVQLTGISLIVKHRQRLSALKKPVPSKQAVF